MTPQTDEKQQNKKWTDVDWSDDDEAIIDAIWKKRQEQEAQETATHSDTSQPS